MADNKPPKRPGPGSNEGWAALSLLISGVAVWGAAAGEAARFARVATRLVRCPIVPAQLRNQATTAGTFRTVVDLSSTTGGGTKTASTASGTVTNPCG